jgi:LmbE family N-acetylglucosaminyl deacetylase
MGDKIDILVVIAHPDDEVFASGTICMCAEEGFRIEFVCATDGEGDHAISYSASRTFLWEKSVAGN